MVDMASTGLPDAIVVGSGPNGLAAAITLAQAGWRVQVREAARHVGGGCSTAELTLPGYLHDVCAAIMPLAVGSPFFRDLPLHQHGLEWIYPPAPLAHPFDDGTAAVLEPSAEATTRTLDPLDARAWRFLFDPLVTGWSEGLDADLLGPLRLPGNLLGFSRFAMVAGWPARGLAEVAFRGERARALFGGMAAHSMLPLERIPSAAFGLVLGALGHAVGWPFPRGGAQRVADALASYLRALGGEVRTSAPVTDASDLPRSRAMLFDLSPRPFLRVAGTRLPGCYRRRLERFRYGVGAFKVDYALDGPIPWKAPACERAGTVHLGGTLREIAEAERAPWQGRIAERPFVLLAQQSRFDPTRAPAGRHTVWAYCHVPNGCREDATDRIEAQIERFAPGFRDRILARSVRPPSAIETDNPNFVGGDINGGVQDLRQLYTRPVARLVPYSTPVPGWYLCSSSTPPGGGVHGMSGYLAARAALAGDVTRRRGPTGLP
jgi:phytoene dehydrogenase-like protein